MPSILLLTMQFVSVGSMWMSLALLWIDVFKMISISFKIPEFSLFCPWLAELESSLLISVITSFMLSLSASLLIYFSI